MNEFDGEAWRGVVTVLQQATSTVWTFEHTGGGCWALSTLADDRWLVVTWADDVLAVGDVPSDDFEHGGFCLGVYDKDDDDGAVWNGLPRWYDMLGCEALPMAAREAVTR